MAKFEDILFWVLIALIIGVAIWKLIGSPTDTAALISIALFVAGSEILLWRAVFSIENKTTVGFMKMKHYIENNHSEVCQQLNDINNRLKR